MARAVQVTVSNSSAINLTGGNIYCRVIWHRACLRGVGTFARAKEGNFSGDGSCLSLNPIADIASFIGSTAGVDAQNPTTQLRQDMSQMHAEILMLQQQVHLLQQRANVLRYGKHSVVQEARTAKLKTLIYLACDQTNMLRMCQVLLRPVNPPAMQSGTSNSSHNDLNHINGDEIMVEGHGTNLSKPHGADSGYSSNGS
ncbi:hypothetical protein CERZMDRAFT_102094 [Cercospora zeae-maydis SCOH1-5]|uniref:Uncharacterized protein n=1 Tax=Cercospora zeae-maydis SCOH1-5 TaxID=717836 RepID=A0A6A6F276_9PEZI|nr:hypothetical protein CERZMDRAFT_102094 [Cercospora zeae-maydis SCOH1-5]